MTGRHTLVHQIQDWSKRRTDEPALHGRRADGSWSQVTWGEYWEQIRAVAKGLLALGHQPGDCVAIMADNRADWVYCEFAIMALGGAPAPIYVTNTTEQVAYVVKHCAAKIAITDNAERLQKYLDAEEAGSMSVEHLVTMDDTGSEHAKVMTLAGLVERGRDVPDSDVDARIAGLKGDDLGLLIYTSGTTGVPKAVMLNHRGLTMIGESVLGMYPELDDPDQYVAVSYLPLCHVAEQLFTNMLHVAIGGQVYFCSDIKLLKEHLLEARPTIFLAVPRVWEKFEAILRGRLAEASGIRGRLASWARQTESASLHNQVASQQIVGGLFRSIANTLVIDKIKAALGLDRVLVATSGAAPISTSTLEFFASIGIAIHEAYGMSETTGAATAQPLHFPRFGTVGKPLAGVEVQIAGDGEIMLRGANMTTGYLHMPEQTAELWSEDGWMHTGDLGAVDADGFLSITGRKKDLIITAGGKNVAPTEIESLLKAIPGVGQAVVVGDRQPYLCALLVLDDEALPQLCAASGSSGSTVAALAVDERVRTFIDARIAEEVNPKLARYQTVKKFHLLPTIFSVDTDELTPTMKIKRNVINVKYAAEIDALYS